MAAIFIYLYNDGFARGWGCNLPERGRHRRRSRCRAVGYPPQCTEGREVQALPVPVVYVFASCILVSSYSPFLPVV